MSGMLQAQLPPNPVKNLAPVLGCKLEGVLLNLFVRMSHLAAKSAIMVLSFPAPVQT